MPTLSALRTRCQQESDNVNSTFVSDAEWLNYINGSYREAYGLLAQRYGDTYFSKDPPQTITTDGTNSRFALASDFFKLLGVELLVTSPNHYVTLKPFAFQDRNRLGVFNNPIPMSGQSVRVHYVPRLTALAVNADATVDAFDVNGWDELIVVDACIKAMGKEESDVSVLMARKAELVRRITSESENRDAANPSRIVDVAGVRARAMQYRLDGSNLWLIGNATPGWAWGGDWGGEYEGGAWGGY